MFTEIFRSVPASAQDRACAQARSITHLLMRSMSPVLSAMGMNSPAAMGPSSLSFQLSKASTAVSVPVTMSNSGW
jgi:hypothetical protein